MDDAPSKDASSKDAFTRRDCLRIGVTAGLGSAFLGLGLPGVSSLARAQATGTGAAKAANPGNGIPIAYLEAGVAALANTWRGYWGNGHYGAAAIAAWFFAREMDLDERTCKAIQAELDAFRSQGSAFFEFETPKEEATPERVPEIVRSLEQGIDSMRGGGHDVIFATLALKAFRQAPELARPQWIDGILKLDAHLRERFRPDADTDFNRSHPVPKWQTPQEMLEFALACFVRNSSAGEVGLIHEITHADAVAELWELGYESLAVRGSEALKIHINLDPALPPPAGVAYADPSPESPLSHAFWENPAVRSKSWGFRGHNFKFPYSYYRSRTATRDAELRKKSDERALSVLATVIR